MAHITKILVAGLGFALVFALSGCAGAASSPSASSQPQDTSAAQTSQESSAAASEQEASSAADAEASSSEAQSTPEAETSSSEAQESPEAEASSSEAPDAAESSDEAAEQEEQPAATTATQRIGEAGIGFVDVPEDYVRFYDVDGNDSIQYSDPTAQSIFSLNVVDLSGLSEEQREAFTLEAGGNNLMVNLDSEGATDIGGAHVTLLGRDAVEVYGTYPDGIMLVMILVEDDEGVIHYISVESPDLDTLNNMITLISNTYAFEA